MKRSRRSPHPKRHQPEIEPLKPENLAWARERFRTLPDGGIWTIPRTGLTFQRRGNTLVLLERMPPSQTGDIIQLGMMSLKPKPGTTADDIAALKQEFLDFQDADYADTKRHFEAIGVSVIDGTKRPVH